MNIQAMENLLAHLSARRSRVYGYSRALPDLLKAPKALSADVASLTDALSALADPYQDVLRAIDQIAEPVLEQWLQALGYVCGESLSLSMGKCSYYDPMAISLAGMQIEGQVMQARLDDNKAYLVLVLHHAKILHQHPRVAGPSGLHAMPLDHGRNRGYSGFATYGTLVVQAFNDELLVKVPLRSAKRSGLTLGKF